MVKLTVDKARELQQLYETTRLSVADIARKVGLSVALIRSTSREKGWRRRPGRKAQSPLRPVCWEGKPCPGLGDCPERAAIIARAWAAAHVQINDIEHRLAPLASDAPSARTVQDDARAVAILARTLRDLTAIDKAERDGRKAVKGGTANDPSDRAAADGTASGDLAEELARRLAALRKRGATS